MLSAPISYGMKIDTEKERKKELTNANQKKCKVFLKFIFYLCILTC